MCSFSYGKSRDARSCTIRAIDFSAPHARSFYWGHVRVAVGVSLFINVRREISVRRETHRFALLVANALRTFDRGIPNSRAIRDGVMPALNADRTAFT